METTLRTYLSIIVIPLLLLLSACGDPKPKKTRTKTKTCYVDGVHAPKWVCSTPSSDRGFIVDGKGKNLSPAIVNAMTKINKKATRLVKKTLNSEVQYKKYSYSEKTLLVNNSKISLIDAIKLKERWKNRKSNQYHVQVSLSFEEINKVIKEEAYKYDHVRVYQGCFNTGSKSLKTSCSKQIKSFLDSVAINDKKNILIEVHTDKGGKANVNLKISQDRARNVARIVNNKEYKNAKTYYVGLGELHPLKDAETKKANNLNRRIKIIVEDKNFKVDTSSFTKYVPSKKNTTARYNSYKERMKQLRARNAKLRAKHEALLESRRTKHQTSSSIVPTLSQKQTSKKQESRWKHSKSNTLNLKSGVSASSSVQIIKYIGEANTGWNYFAKKDLKKKFETRCIDDQPSKMKRKSTQGSKVLDYKHGMYGKPWYTNVDSYTMAITPMFLFENNYLPLKNPKFKVIKNDRVVKELETTVNVYEGEEGILYRVFFEKKDSFQCMDLMIKNKSSSASYGLVYYVENAKLKQFKFRPKIH